MILNRYLTNLHDIFALYHQLNYSVIPILGDLSPATPKAASVEWKEWQTKRATPATFDHWVRQGKVGGLAIVTGQVSRLVVLDFDQTEQVEAFKRMCPLLWNSTRRVISAERQLPHVYFQVPPELADRLHSQTFVGLDVQYEGRYVITEGTEIAGRSYHREWGGVPLTLNEVTLGSLLCFLQSQTPLYPVPAKVEDLIAIHLASAAAGAVRPMALPPISPEQAQQKYEQLATTGRNNALFAVALELRDSGYVEQEALRILLPMHLQTRQKRETALQREQEAKRTITSAYSRPARERQGAFPAQLPNALREALNRQGKTALARVFDGLLQGNVRPGDLITYRKAVEVCQAVQVGAYSVRRFFAELPVLLGRVGDVPTGSNDGRSPLTPPIALAGLPTASADCSSQNAICEGGQNQQERICNLGRPPKSLCLPTFAELAKALAVTHYVAVDELPRTALASVHTYRTAQVHALIARRPDLYPQAFLQWRHGVSRRTLRRYLRNCAAVSCPHYNEIPLVWANLNEIPDPDYLPSYTNRAQRSYTPGWFLEDQHGKRYPAYRGIAQRLLKAGATVTLKVQTANYYYAAQQPQVGAQWQAEQVQAHQAVEQRRQQWHQRLTERRAFFTTQAATHAQNPSAATVGSRVETGKPNPLPLPHEPKSSPAAAGKPPPRSAVERQTTRNASAKRKYRQPLSATGLENLAQRLQQAAPALSLWSARRLVDQYGYALCQQALVTLRKRGGVKDRAAWLYSYVRSEAKFSNQPL